MLGRALLAAAELACGVFAAGVIVAYAAPQAVREYRAKARDLLPELGARVDRSPFAPLLAAGIILAEWGAPVVEGAVRVAMGQNLDEVRA